MDGFQYVCVQISNAWTRALESARLEPRPVIDLQILESQRYLDNEMKLGKQRKNRNYQQLEDSAQMG